MDESKLKKVENDTLEKGEEERIASDSSASSTADGNPEVVSMREAGEGGQAAPKGKPAKPAKSTGKKRTWTIARHVVQVCALLVFLLPVLVAGWMPFGLTEGSDGILNTPAELPFYGTLASSTIGSIVLVDPFAYLQAIAASKSVQTGALIGALIILAVYALLRGRVFCGWVCPVNLVLEIVDALRKKLGLKVAEMPVPRHVKVYVAAAVIVLSLILSLPVYEIFNPIGILNRGLVLGATTGVVTLIAIIAVELFWGHRVWCRSICPLGGFWECVGKVGLLMNVHIDHDACIACDKCKKACLCDPAILDDCIAGNATIVKAGDCMACGKCVEACPTNALSIKPGRK